MHLQISCITPLFMTTLEERSGDHQIIRIHPLGTMNVCTKCNGNPSNSYCNISVWINEVDSPILLSLEPHHCLNRSNQGLLVLHSATRGQNEPICPLVSE